jgi:hypothetical protein
LEKAKFGEKSVSGVDARADQTPAF